MRIGVDSYGLKPLGLSPLQLLEWAEANGAEGVQFSEGAPEARDQGYLREIRDRAAAAGLYLEWGGGQHLPYDPANGRPLDIDATNRRAAEEAAALGTSIVRSCSGGLMRWEREIVPTETHLREMAASFRAQASLLRDHGVILAVETHFEFTTFEILRAFDMAGAEPGGQFGVCLDTMNLLTMMEDPAAASRRVLPWIVATHIKDGGILAVEGGFRTFTAEAGAGVVDFPSIIGLLSEAASGVTLSIEDHGGDFFVPWKENWFRARFPDLTAPELKKLEGLAEKTRRLVNEEGLVSLERERWPQVCEVRMLRDLAAIKAIVHGRS